MRSIAEALGRSCRSWARFAREHGLGRARPACGVHHLGPRGSTSSRRSPAQPEDRGTMVRPEGGGAFGPWRTHGGHRAPCPRDPSERPVPAAMQQIWRELSAPKTDKSGQTGRNRNHGRTKPILPRTSRRTANTLGNPGQGNRRKQALRGLGMKPTRRTTAIILAVKARKTLRSQPGRDRISHDPTAVEEPIRSRRGESGRDERRRPWRPPRSPAARSA